MKRFSAKEFDVFDSEFEQNLFELRKEKLKEIEKLGQAAYPNRFPARQDQSAITLGRGARAMGRSRRRRSLKPSA